MPDLCHCRVATLNRFRVGGVARTFRSVSAFGGPRRSRDLAITAGNAVNVEYFGLPCLRLVQLLHRVPVSRFRLKESEHVRLAWLMQRCRRLVGGCDGPCHYFLHPSQYFRPCRPYFAASADRSSQRDPFQSLAKDACGAWRLVGILEPRMAQRSSTARPTRAIPPILPRLRR